MIFFFFVGRFLGGFQGKKRHGNTSNPSFFLRSYKKKKEITKPIDSDETRQNKRGTNANARNKKLTDPSSQLQRQAEELAPDPSRSLKFDISLPFFRPGLPVFCSTYDAANVLLPRSRNVNLQRLKLGFALEKTARLTLDNFFTISGFNGSMGCLRG